MLPLIVTLSICFGYMLMSAGVAGLYKRRGTDEVEALMYGFFWPGLPAVWFYHWVAGRK